MYCKADDNKSDEKTGVMGCLGMYQMANGYIYLILWMKKSNNMLPLIDSINSLLLLSTLLLSSNILSADLFLFYKEIVINGDHKYLFILQYMQMN